MKADRGRGEGWPGFQRGRAPAAGDRRKGTATEGDDPSRDDNKAGSNQQDRENRSLSPPNGEGE